MKPKIENEHSANLMRVSLGITGFESPASAYSQAPLSLHSLLIASPSAMSVTVAQEDDLAGKGIFKGDLMVVNQSLTPAMNDAVLCLYNGQVICRLIDTHNNLLFQVLPDGQYVNEPIVSEMDDFKVLGVVPFCIRVHADPDNRFKDFDAENRFFSELPYDLDDLVNINPVATFIAKGSGHSMQNVGIFDGDLIFVDRALEAVNGSVVVCNCDGEFACKMIDLPNNLLLSAGGNHAPQSINHFTNFSIEGVVAVSIRLLTPVPELM
ncbi:S24 family peptidase [Shewanella aestuarii]|uniref:Peptidase S24/S26A/S26B/S26C domain-containing protein n=1 Tax=Shewanella aestuarii TaxID=1028752 RepID=A0A6G9QR93_9GAMM|nr:S24 family peptidase [Shewanella aestuarii]QIR16575.1 hypothetical protein HBH39_19055 [Shewanella aestuarii]